MEFYFDIKLTGTSEKPINRLVNAIYTKFHNTLCDMKATDIGVSFPAQKVLLGNIIRIHAAQHTLAALQELGWPGVESGHCQVSSIHAIPERCKHRTISRKQANMSPSKLKRLLTRGSITQQEAKHYKATMFSKGLLHPYVELISGSSGNKYRRYIEFGELQDVPVSGVFDQFGLSKTATVPWF